MLLQEKLNVTVEHCGCGKECEVWDNLMREKVLSSMGTYEDKDMLVHIGYPYNYCHCVCGSEFGKHKVGIIGRAKTRCVSCRRKINPKDYIENGNYCFNCNLMCDTAGRKLSENQKLNELLYGQSSAITSNTGLSKNKQGQECDDKIGDEGGVGGGSLDDYFLSEPGDLDGDVGIENF